ncbi:MAG: NlpC/P60 family protein [Chitinophagaceae bacterium]|nr:MAG: NlpC/P60 family protein [Chitinophagaceae bacterium]
MRFFSILLISFILLFSSCASNKVSSLSKKTTKNTHQKLVNNIISDSELYLGTPYQYGGTNKNGIDCSGLVYLVFKDNNIHIPRVSAQQAKTSKPVPLNKAQKGDLIFFATSGGRKVSHVGIIHDIPTEGSIRFIHASSSKGVIISSLDEAYWKKAFLFIKTYIE